MSKRSATSAQRPSDTAIPFVRVAVLNPFIAHLEAASVPVQRYLDQSGLSPASMEQPEVRIPLRFAHRFLSKAADVEGIRDIGLQVGRKSSLDDLGGAGELLLASRNIMQYLQLGHLFISEFSSIDRIWLEPQDDFLRICYAQLLPGISPFSEQTSNFNTLLITINTIRAVAGQSWCPAEMTFPSLSVNALSELQEWLPGTRFVTGCHPASLLLHRDILPLRMRTPSSPERIEPRPRFNAERPVDFLESARWLAHHLILDGRPSLPLAAEAAGLSTRSFQRRLMQAGTSFATLLAETRIDIAEHWLADEPMTVTEIALTLGYSDRSNFTRAFRRMNGLSPQEYRARLPVRPQPLAQ